MKPTVLSLFVFCFFQMSALYGQPASKALQGAWKLEKVTMNGEKVSMEEIGSVLHFKSDGTYEEIGNSETTEEKYRVEKDMLLIGKGTSALDRFKIKKLNKKQLILEMSQGDQKALMFLSATTIPRK